MKKGSVLRTAATRLLSLIAFAGSSAVAQDSLPDKAPEGKEWMSCWLNVHNDSAGVGFMTVIAGYWLIPADQEKEYGARWISEYLPRLGDEFPGYAAFPGGADQPAQYSCASYPTRTEFWSYGQSYHKPLDRVLRSDFHPTFSLGTYPVKLDPTNG